MHVDGVDRTGEERRELEELGVEVGRGEDDMSTRKVERKVRWGWDEDESEKGEKEEEKWRAGEEEIDERSRREQSLCDEIERRRAKEKTSGTR